MQAIRAVKILRAASKSMLSSATNAVDHALMLALPERSEKGKPLERCGANLVMCVILHGMKHGKFTQTRHMGWFADDMPWAGLFVPAARTMHAACNPKFSSIASLRSLEQVAACTHVSINHVKTLSFSYTSASTGKRVDMSGTPALRSWLDSSWLSHPLEIHAYPAALPAHEQAESSQLVRQTFNKYDVSGSGVLSIAEVRLMLNDLCSDLSVSSADISDWVDEQINRADANSDGVCTFAEFGRYFEGLREFARLRLSRDAQCVS